MDEAIVSLEYLELTRELWTALPWYLNAVLVFMVLNPIAALVVIATPNKTDDKLFYWLRDKIIKPLALDLKSKHEDPHKSDRIDAQRRKGDDIATKSANNTDKQGVGGSDSSKKGEVSE